jgi:S13-like H2TH domain
VQRMDALQRANQIRTARAQLKKDLKAGRRSIHELLQSPPEYLETAKVFDMLVAVPKYGRVKANKVLTQCRISPSKTIGGLSERQRTELVASLRR